MPGMRKRACDTCSNLKLRCTRTESTGQCERCQRLNFTCSHEVREGGSTSPRRISSTATSRRPQRGRSTDRDLAPPHQYTFNEAYSQETTSRSEPVKACSSGSTVGFEDPVSVGILTETEGRRLFDIFMRQCLFAVPLLDLENDTWDSFRLRSSIAISTIMYLGLKCEEGGHEPSDAHIALRDHTERLAMTSLFTPIASVEIVQALVLLGQWGDTSWRPGGHALRIAMEMKLWQCLPQLIAKDIEQVKTSEQLELEAPLVVGARAWLAIFNTEHQMAYNSGQPLMISPETIRDRRSFLKHPLAIPTDIRLVSFCELQIIRSPLHDPLDLKGPVWEQPDFDTKVTEANEALNSWSAYWDTFYGEVNELQHAAKAASLGYHDGHLLRESLASISSGTKFFCNAGVIKSIQNSDDVETLSPIRYTFLLKAVEAGERILERPLRGGKVRFFLIVEMTRSVTSSGLIQQYRESFPFANSSTYMNVAHVAWHLIHIASLFPHLIDRQRLSDNVESCADLLDTVPGYRFGRFLRKILRKARRTDIIPPSSRASVPLVPASEGISGPDTLLTRALEDSWWGGDWAMFTDLDPLLNEPGMLQAGPMPAIGLP